MAKVDYSFWTDNSKTKVKRLLFENAYGVTISPSNFSGVLQIPVVNLLEIDIKCEGPRGARWALYVNVNDNPIINSHLDNNNPGIFGVIEGTIPASGESLVINGYAW